MSQWKDMSKNEYRRALDALDMSQMGAAVFLGVAPRTSQSYALGETKVTKSIALLLRTMVHLKLEPADVEKMPVIPK